MDSHVNVITCLTESGRRGLTAERHIAESRRPRLCVMLACMRHDASDALAEQLAPAELPTDLTAMTPQS